MLNNKSGTGNTDTKQVIEDVMPVISRLPNGKKVKTADLFEPVVWQGTTMSEHIKLGRVVTDLSRMKLLPLRIIESASNNHRQFVVDHH